MKEDICKDSFIAGMELAMRICRNRKTDIENLRSLDYPKVAALVQNQIEICIFGIRQVQVEIGSGRMPLPEFTEDEKDEIERIR